MFASGVNRRLFIAVIVPRDVTNLIDTGRAERTTCFCGLINVRGWNFQVTSGFLLWRRDRHEARSFARPFKAKAMTQDFIFAHDGILDPATAKIVSVVRNGGVWRDGTRIAVLVGAQMYDLNGNLLGKLAGDGSLPISFKNLVEDKSAHSERALVA